MHVLRSVGNKLGKLRGSTVRIEELEGHGAGGEATSLYGTRERTSKDVSRRLWRVKHRGLGVPLPFADLPDDFTTMSMPSPENVLRTSRWGLLGCGFLLFQVWLHPYFFFPTLRLSRA